jgi:DNA-binding transcriptional MerR regulator
MPRHSFALAAVPNQEGRSAPSAGDNTDVASGFTISDLAREYGVTLRTLRFYESRGLLAPSRSGMTRIYSGRDRARLALILKGKQLGFTLIEIRAMLANEDKKGEAAAGSTSVGGLQLSREQIAEQLELLRSQRSEIEEAIVELEATQSRVAKEARAAK